ncbi:hypothetical protein LNKW23_28690 [Paralimibaculum aggregatum]|uniref:Phosphatidate cytidylyltransferase n=1 Tax=Paralimibaculum aggregatum TaxID=3036245 RepID=A0ABQ6LK79_9RHOB|nr:phosphatidate cytidylyltransferase [Limibaculum sp. NKW23]GMG83656.1 hypothetical protein LNKW23_28690 [Limibaculum sp. NKW23]
MGEARTPAQRFADLRTRTLSGIAVAAGAFGLLWVGGLPFACLVAALAAVTAWEFRAITAAGLGGGWLAAVAAALPVLALPLLPQAAALGLLAAGAALAAGSDLLARRPAPAAWIAGGVGLVGLAAMALVALRLAEPYGLETAFWIALVVVLTDIGGYFAGRLIGGPLLWPTVSPKKTWAGLGGGVALAFFGGGLFSWATTGTYFYEVCTVSAIAALLAQGGDLAESALKRRFGVKDAGRLIPGHGGALDRFDGLMAATLVAAAVTFWRGKAVFIW